MKSIITKANGEKITKELKTNPAMLKGSNAYSLAKRMYWEIYPNGDTSMTVTKNADGSFLVRDQYECDCNKGGITVRFEA